MRKIWPTLGLVLILVGWGVMGYGIGASPAQAQYYEPGYQYCDPYNYCTYYNAPYENPSEQFFFYAVPHFGEEFEEHEFREHRGHERFEHGERHERGGEHRR